LVALGVSQTAHHESFCALLADAAPRRGDHRRPLAGLRAAATRNSDTRLDVATV
jgi:hypothetical protein